MDNRNKTQNITFAAMMKRSLLLVVLISAVCTVQAQRFSGFRLSMQAGLSFPMENYSSMAANLSEPGEYLTSGADRGFDFNLNGEIFLSEKLGLLVRLGYALHEIDENRLQNSVREYWQTSDESAFTSMSTSPYQNLYLAAGFGYSIPFIRERFDVQPYVYGGFNILRTASKNYEIAGENEGEVYRFNSESEISPGIIVMPGINFNLRLMPFLELRVFGELAGANHRADADIEAIEGSADPMITKEEINYEIRYLNTGAALSFRF